jgi:hypothetical protein
MPVCVGLATKDELINGYVVGVYATELGVVKLGCPVMYSKEAVTV